MSRSELFIALIVFLSINLFVFFFPFVLKPVFSIWEIKLLTYFYAFFIFGLCLLLSAYALFACFIKRLNDLEVSRLWALLLFVPPLNGFFVLYFLIARPPNCFLLRLQRFLFHKRTMKIKALSLFSLLFLFIGAALIDIYNPRSKPLIHIQLRIPRKPAAASSSSSKEGLAKPKPEEYCKVHPQGCSL